MKRAVVLLSGGLDSSTVLAIARNSGFELFALTMDYGQRHREELISASRVAEQFYVCQHVIVPIDLRVFGGSSLTSALPVPKRRSTEAMQSAIPPTYVPARNTIFLSFALAWTEVLDANDIFLGVNAVDYSGYPDCRPEYIAAFERMANLATKAAIQNGRHVTIHAPLIHMTKAEIIRTGLALGVDYAATSTCYDPSADGEACGECDACILRQKGFQDNGMQDPRISRRIRGHAISS
jgi:7-cyano-7-deazaguanine synthase